MLRTDYIAPEVNLFYCEVEHGFASSNSAGVNFGIGGWDADSEDYGGYTD